MGRQARKYRRETVVRGYRWLRRFGYGFLLVVGLWLASGALLATLLTSRLSQVAPEVLPNTAVDDVRSLRFANNSGHELGAWFHRGDSADCLLLLHGNRASRTAMFPLFDALSRAGDCVLAVTLSGHGDSGGELLDAGWSARHDVAAAVSALEREAPGRPVVVVGTSMGAAAAIFAAPQLAGRVSGYVFEALYRDLETAVRARTELYLPAPLDAVAYLTLRLWAPLLIGVPIQQINPLLHANRVPLQIPVALLSGSADRRAPLADVWRIHEALGRRSQLAVFPGAKHQSLYRVDPQHYLQVLASLRARARTGAL